MNSSWPIGPLPKPTQEYSEQYMMMLVKAIEDTLSQARSPGLIEVQRANISSLPTSAVGLRAGDLWNDTGTVKVA
jgi:hypothetical protein